MSFSTSTDAIHPLAASFFSKCNYRKNLFSHEIFAVNQYVKKLVGYNLWDKFIGLYPFVGRSANLHSINLKSPGLYDVWWCGTGLVHNHLGVTGTGSGFGNTLIALNQMTTPDIHISVYNGTYWANANSVDYLIGATDGYAGNRIILKDSSPNYTYTLGDNGYTYGLPNATLLPIDTSFIPWEEWNGSKLGGVAGSLLGNKFTDGYFAGELTDSQVASQVYGHIIGSKSRYCFVQGESFGHIADSTVPYHSIFFIKEGLYDNMSMAPIMLLRNGKFGTSGTCSLANIRMASVGYGLTPEEASLFFVATQEFESVLGRSVERIYLATVSESQIESISISESIFDLISEFGYLYGENENTAEFSAYISNVVITGPRVYPITDEGLDVSVEIVGFSYENE